MRRNMIPALCVLTLSMACGMGIRANAADFSFDTVPAVNYYGATSYEDTFGSRYIYGQMNAVDLQTVELTYGANSTTQIGIMEKTQLPYFQFQNSNGGNYVGGAEGGYGIGSSETIIPSYPKPVQPVLPTIPSYTQASEMVRSDGSIGTLKIPSLDINMKVWRGETSESMRKGLGHYNSTSGWDGNVGVCGHNRGSRYSIGAIKDLDIGDTITYTTIYGTRQYKVDSVMIISKDDWSYLQATADNRITVTTCLANHPESRVCVQAIEV